MSGTSITIAEPQSDIANLVFYGIDGNECEEFVVSIRRFAFKEGKARDEDWMLDLATICLRGKALRWHASLEKSIKQDWDHFVQALFEEYPMGSMSSSVVSTSPAVHSVFASAASPTSARAREGPQIGKLRLVGANFPGMDYVASNGTNPKDFYGTPISFQRTTLAPDKADMVRLIQFDNCIGLRLSVSDRPYAFSMVSGNWLGVAWDDVTGVGAVSPGQTLAGNPAPFALISSHSWTYSKRVRDSASQIWRIDANGTLSATCNPLGVSTPGEHASYIVPAFLIDQTFRHIDSQPSYLTTVAVHMADQTMYFVREFEEFVKDAPSLYYEARLVFEPMNC